MEINTNNTVNSQVQGLETTAKVSEVKREKEDTPEQRATLAQEDPGYRISLSDASKTAATEVTGPQAADQELESTDLSDEEAAQLAQKASEQLSQTNASISNQAIQNAVNLFT